MQITKEQLKQIIKEELQSVLREGEDWGQRGSPGDLALGMGSGAGGLSGQPTDLGARIIATLKPFDFGLKADMLAAIESEGLAQDAGLSAEDVLAWALDSGEITSSG